MLRGFYTAASGMLIQQRTLNTLANNVANVRTPGFKVERVVSTSFEHELMIRQEQANNTYIGASEPIRVVEEVSTLFDPSLLEETGRPFDFAINGEGFFNVQVGEQQFLTRNGSFDLDEEGYLILPGAGRVLGEKGEIELGSAYFTIDSEGMIYNADGKKLDKLLVTVPPEGVRLQKFSNGLYTVEDFQANQTVEDAQLVQGTIERSNIDLNREYTLVMEAQRTFQSCSAALKIMDELNQKAATQIASV